LSSSRRRRIDGIITMWNMISQKRRRNSKTGNREAKKVASQALIGEIETRLAPPETKSRNGRVPFTQF